MSELKLLPCPFCHAQAKIGYACGDYFVHCSDRCPSPMCDHASESTTVCSWNDWAEWYEKNRRTQPENSRQHALQTGVCPMCEDCPDGCPVETPKDSRNKMTNAQKIRAMGDEELAKIIASEHMAERIPFCQNKPECSRILEETEDCIPESMCVECVLDWLQQPVETEGTE